MSMVIDVSAIDSQGLGGIASQVTLQIALSVRQTVAFWKTSLLLMLASPPTQLKAYSATTTSHIDTRPYMRLLVLKSMEVVVALQPSLDKRRQVCRLVGRFLALSSVAKTELQSMIGSFVYPFMHARTLMSIFDQSYTRIALMPEHGFKMWDPVVKEEMLASVLFLPNAEANLRACVSSLISATDATITHTGACQAAVPKNIAQFLYRRTEKRGEHVRLDWGEDEANWIPSKMREPSEETDNLAMSMSWSRPAASRFASRSHINVQEVLAAVDELER